MNKQKEEEPKQETQELEVLREPMAIGEIFAKSGMFPDIKTQAQAAVKILAGREIGLTPFEAMNSLYIVNGKLAIMSNVMASKIKKSNKYDYKIDKLDDQECTLTFFKVNGEKEAVGTSTFTFKDAAKAGLVNKENWKSYPRNMLFSRALANGVRWYAPDVVCGDVVEELEELTKVKHEKTITMTKEGVVEKDGEATVQQ